MQGIHLPLTVIVRDSKDFVNRKDQTASSLRPAAKSKCDCFSPVIREKVLLEGTIILLTYSKTCFHRVTSRLNQP